MSGAEKKNDDQVFPLDIIYTPPPAATALEKWLQRIEGEKAENGAASEAKPSRNRAARNGS